jgi:hypothetical protein
MAQVLAGGVGMAGRIRSQESEVRDQKPHLGCFGFRISASDFLGDINFLYISRERPKTEIRNLRRVFSELAYLVASPKSVYNSENHRKKLLRQGNEECRSVAEFWSCKALPIRTTN